MSSATRRQSPSATTEAALYSIGVVSRMVGVPVSTLRSWEERYRLIVAVRSSGGQRRYTRTQFAALSFVVKQIGQGFSPGGAPRVRAEQLDEGGAVLDAGEADRAEPGVLVLIAERDRVA